MKNLKFQKREWQCPRKNKIFFKFPKSENYIPWKRLNEKFQKNIKNNLHFFKNPKFHKNNISWSNFPHI